MKRKGLKPIGRTFEMPANPAGSTTALRLTQLVKTPAFDATEESLGMRAALAVYDGVAPAAPAIPDRPVFVGAMFLSVFAKEVAERRAPPDISGALLYLGAQCDERIAAFRHLIADPATTACAISQLIVNRRQTDGIYGMDRSIASVEARLEAIRKASLPAAPEPQEFQALSERLSQADADLALFSKPRDGWLSRLGASMVLPAVAAGGILGGIAGWFSFPALPLAAPACALVSAALAGLFSSKWTRPHVLPPEVAYVLHELLPVCGPEISGLFERRVDFETAVLHREFAIRLIAELRQTSAWMAFANAQIVELPARLDSDSSKLFPGSFCIVDRGLTYVGGAVLAATLAAEKLASRGGPGAVLRRAAQIDAALPLSDAVAAFPVTFRNACREILGNPSPLPSLLARLRAQGEETVLRTHLSLLRNFAVDGFDVDNQRKLDRRNPGSLDVALPDADRDADLAALVKDALQIPGTPNQSMHPDAIEIVWHAVTLDYRDSHHQQRSLELRREMPSEIRRYWTVLGKA